MTVPHQDTTILRSDQWFVYARVGLVRQRSCCMSTATEEDHKQVAKVNQGHTPNWHRNLHDLKAG